MQYIEKITNGYIFVLSFLNICVVNTIYLFSFVETPRKFIIAEFHQSIISTDRKLCNNKFTWCFHKLNKYIFVLFKAKQVKFRRAATEKRFLSFNSKLRFNKALKCYLVLLFFCIISTKFPVVLATI